MTRPLPTTTPMNVQAVRTHVESELADFLDTKTHLATGNRLPQEASLVLRDFLLAGGKRLRPLLCVIGWHTAGGEGDTIPVLRTAAALEMFHAFALIHDDVMDHSDTRRGEPTVHRKLAGRHTNGRTVQAAQDLGVGAAILVGDLALCWSDELLHTAGLMPAQLARVRPLVDAMRAEVMYGQYLDLTATGQPSTDIGHARAIIRYKTAKYTCERPLHIGAALAAADDALLTRLSAFALPLGEAFQLRDDLLGVFGNEAETGKPALDDLREGKHTVLIAQALQSADPTQARLLRSLYGNPHLDEDGAATVRALLEATKAPTAVEGMIRDAYEQAMTALDDAPLRDEARSLLHVLAHQAVWRKT